MVVDATGKPPPTPPPNLVYGEPLTAPPRTAEEPKTYKISPEEMNRFKGPSPDKVLQDLGRDLIRPPSENTPWDRFVKKFPDKDPFGLSAQILDFQKRADPNFAKQYDAAKDMSLKAEGEWEAMGSQQKEAFSKAGIGKDDYVMFRLKEQFNERFADETKPETKTYTFSGEEVAKARGQVEKTPSRPPEGMVRIVDENTGEMSDIPKKDFLNKPEYAVFGSKKDRTKSIMDGAHEFHKPMDNLSSLEEKVGHDFKFDRRSTITYKELGDGAFVIEGHAKNGDRCSITIQPGGDFQFKNHHAAERKEEMESRGLDTYEVVTSIGKLEPDMVTNLQEDLRPRQTTVTFERVK